MLTPVLGELRRGERKGEGAGRSMPHPMVRAGGEARPMHEEVQEEGRRRCLGGGGQAHSGWGGAGCQLSGGSSGGPLCRELP